MDLVGFLLFWARPARLDGVASAAGQGSRRPGHPECRLSIAGAASQPPPRALKTATWSLASALFEAARARSAARTSGRRFEEGDAIPHRNGGGQRRDGRTLSGRLGDDLRRLPGQHGQLVERRGALSVEVGTAARAASSNCFWAWTSISDAAPSVLWRTVMS
jgi:hypothetical protein